MKKARVRMNRQVYLVVSILDMSEIVMYNYWYGYVKSKYGIKTKLCYMDTETS